MFGFFSVITLVLVSLVISWNIYNIQFSKRDIILYISGIAIILIVIETFRQEDINPDYYLYLQYIKFPDSYCNDAEPSFFNIVRFTHYIGGTHLLVFFIYALLGICLKMTAIIKYSPNIFYSIAVWICFFYILQDLIQIRAAVSGSFLLFMIPSIYNGNYIKALVYWLFAFIFHNSAIVFVILFFFKKDSINPWLWISGYVTIFIINTLNLPIFTYVFKAISFLPMSIASRIGNSDPTILNEMARMTMYSRYILIPSIYSIVCLFRIKNIQSSYPYAILCLKTCMIGIMIYGVGLPIVSERLFEILSIPYIYLIPLCLYWFKRNSLIKGKIAITTFCIFMAWNLLFKQNVFS